MSFEVARLAVKADTTDLKRGEAALESFARTGAQTERVAQTVGKSATGMARSFGGTSNSLRMASMQLSQVAQQGAVTGNYLQALAIQLPDLALGFGTLGILAGVAAGALLPLAANFLSTSDGALELEGAMESLSEITKALQSDLDLVRINAEELVNVYGQAADRVRRFALAQAELGASQAARRLEDQVLSMRDLVASYDTAGKSGRNLRTIINRITEDFDIATDMAYDFGSALSDLSNADTFDEQQAALSNILDLLEDNNIELSQVPPEIARAISEMITFSNETDRARYLMAQLAGEAAGVTIGVPLYEQNLEGGLLPPQAPPKVSPRRRGGGGRAAPRRSKEEIEAERKHQQALRESEQIFNRTRTAAEAYAIELADLNELHEMGYLDAETYQRAMDQLGAEYENLSGLNATLKDSIIDAAMGGEDAFGQLADAIKRAAIEYALFGTGALAPAGAEGGGGILGGLLGSLGGLLSFEGGGYTGSGPRSGGVDGRGGMLSILHPNETVTDHTRGGSGGTVRIVIEEAPGFASRVRTEAQGVAVQVVQGAARSNEAIRARS